MHAIGTLGEAPIFIDDSAVLTVPEIRAKSRRLQAEHGLDLVIVDYLQLLHSASLYGENRASELGKITRSLKELARELSVPVIAAAQLSRAVESRTPHIPMLSDLRESGSIEQDADVVMFIFREEYYLNRAEPTPRADDSDEKFNTRYAKWSERLEEVAGVAEVIVAKQRHGPTGNVRLHFSGKTTKFSNLETHHDRDDVPF